MTRGCDVISRGCPETRMCAMLSTAPRVQTQASPLNMAHTGHGTASSHTSIPSDIQTYAMEKESTYAVEEESFPLSSPIAMWRRKAFLLWRRKAFLLHSTGACAFFFKDWYTSHTEQAFSGDTPTKAVLTKFATQRSRFRARAR